jgi:hypothetical protein
MRQLLAQYARPLSFLVLLIVALLGVYGLGHQYEFARTQTDCVALARVVKLALSGHSPYDRALVTSTFGALPFTVDELFYPPSFIPFVAPFVGLGEIPFRIFVVALQVLCFWYVISRSARGVSPQYRSWVYLSPVVFLALFQTARFGQISCFVCAAALYFWDSFKSNRTGVWGCIVLFVASIKPSAVLAILIFLLLEREFLVITSVCVLHAVCTYVASVLTGVDSSLLLSGWLEAVAHYRELPQNSPSGSFVYGASVLLERVSGVTMALDFAAVPLSVLVWRMRRSFSVYECVALLLLISFIVGSPHAYDLLFLVPALFCVLERRRGLCIYSVVSAMLLLPQRVLHLAGVSFFDSALRVLAPLVLLVFLLRSRQLVGVATTDLKSLPRRRVDERDPLGV